MSDMPSRLRELREARSLSQEGFAALCGASKNTQNNYETGKRKPTYDYLEALAAAGVDVIYLLTGRRDPKLLNDQQKRLLSLFEDLNADARQVLIGLLEAVKTGRVAKGESDTVRQRPGGAPISFQNPAKPPTQD